MRAWRSPGGQGPALDGGVGSERVGPGIALRCVEERRGDQGMGRGDHRVGDPVGVGRVAGGAEVGVQVGGGTVHAGQPGRAVGVDRQPGDVGVPHVVGREHRAAGCAGQRRAGRAGAGRAPTGRVRPRPRPAPAPPSLPLTCAVVESRPRHLPRDHRTPGSRALRHPRRRPARLAPRPPVSRLRAGGPACRGPGGPGLRSARSSTAAGRQRRDPRPRPRNAARRRCRRRPRCGPAPSPRR